MNYQSILKRQTSIILISVIFMVLIIIGVSYSLFMQVDESKDIQVLESGTLVLFSTKGTTITTSTVPQSDYDGMNTEGYTFSIKNTGTLDCYYTLYISNVASTNPVDPKYIRISIDDGEPITITDLDVDPENSSRFIFEIGQLSAANQDGDVVTHNIKVWIDEFAPASIIGKKIQLQVDLYGETFENIPASPELYAGLIPITYDEDTNVVIADTNEEWYNYDNLEWANAILIDQSNTDIKNKYINSDNSYKAGTIVDMADILQMYVWIPRYRYRIPSMLCSELDSPTQDTYSECYKFNPNGEAKNNLVEWLYNSGWRYGSDRYASLEEARTALDNAIATGSFSEYYTLEEGLEDYQMYGGGAFTDNDYDFVPSASVTGPRMIDIIFEDSSLPKSNGDAVNGYLTHPAFTFGDTELNGIWVGKFESSGATDNITIVPNVASLRNLTISDIFNATRNIETNTKYALTTTEVDTHMMKNIEWGAVAYLSQSKYGKYNNPNYTDANKEVYINNSSSYITGSSGGSPNASSGGRSYAWNVSTRVDYTKNGENNQTVNPTVTNDTTYPWALTNGTYKSTTQGVQSSTTNLTFNFNLPQMGELSFDWTVSSESVSYDYIYYTITKDGNNLTDAGNSAKIGGTSFGTDESSLTYNNVTKVLEPGTYTITFTYIKDSSGDSGTDAGYVKNLSIKYGATYTKEEVYTEENGVGASTTGNIYGIYDMSGGAREYVMGNMTDSSGAFYPSDSGLSQPDSKYYDSYTYGSSYNDYSRGHLGDATKEVSEWNNDTANFVYSPDPWFVRSGSYYNGSSAGVFNFYFDANSSNANSEYSFRVVLSSE